MRKIIENLKAKPRHTKKQFSFLVALMSTLAIAGVWSTTLPSRLSLSGMQGSDQLASVVSVTGDLLSENGIEDQIQQALYGEGGVEGEVAAEVEPTDERYDLGAFPDDLVPQRSAETSEGMAKKGQQVQIETTPVEEAKAGRQVLIETE